MNKAAQNMLNSFTRLVERYATGIGIAATALLMSPTTAAHADIVFEAKVAGPVTNIYSVDDSGTLHKLTDNIRWRDMDSDVSADGRVAFISNRRQKPKSDKEKRRRDFSVHVTATDARAIKQITQSSTREVSPRLSPDGRRIAFIRHFNDRHELMVTRIDSDIPETLDTADSITNLSWSPDGKQLCYTPVEQHTSSLATVNLAGGDTKTLLTSSMRPDENSQASRTAPAQYVSARWSPDGEHIAFILHPLKQGVRELRVFNLEDQSDRRISHGSVQVQNRPTWSEGGDKILYSALVDYKFYYDETEYKKVYEGGMHIFLADLDGENRQLTEGDVLFKNPVFSPNGERIAFLYADRLDARTLMLKTMNIDGSDTQTLFDSVAQRSQLHWY